MRVLANQFEEEYTKLAKRYDRRFRPIPVLDVKIQTGERPDDPRLLGNLIFATIDQSLSSALAVPYSLSAGMANLNAGAFYSSYLIFDEFHLFPVGEGGNASGALVTTLQLLARLQGIIPFVLMTATFSSTMLGELAQRLGAEVVTVCKKEYLQIAAGDGKQARRRYYHVHEETLSADAILDAHNEDDVVRSIVICNQVARAQNLYQALRDHAERNGTEIRLLHSRFTPEDRKQKEEEIRREFGKESEERVIDNLILVATQIVEVGLDITCDRLHTEIAPANAVFQRAGRCARYPGEVGQVHIYQVPTRNLLGEEKPDYLPYSDVLCTDSLQSFRERNEQELDFEDEQTIIDEVHTEADRNLLCAMDQQQGLIWGDHLQRNGGPRTQPPAGSDSEHRQYHCVGSSRPRGTRQPPLLPKGSACTEAAYTASGASCRRWQVSVTWRNLRIDPGRCNTHCPVSAMMKTPRKKSDTSGTLSITPISSTTQRWLSLTAPSAPMMKNWVFRVQSPCDKTGWVSKQGKSFPGNRFGGYSYQLESYSEHIERMVGVYESQFKDDYTYMQRKLTELWKLPPDGLSQAIRLAISCHDLGKLDRRWQRWVRLYQEKIGEPIYDPTCMAVHTDYDPANQTQREAKRQTDKQVTRPKHAAESVVAAAPIIAKHLGPQQKDLARAVMTAIARHHSTGTDSYAEFSLHQEAGNALEQAMEAAQLPAPERPILMSSGRGGKLDRILIKPEQFRSLLLYLYVVRMLRLCDGLSQERS